MRICFDLDNTLCTGKPYAEAKPYAWAAPLLESLKEKGYTIIIYTARNMNTYNGNIGLVNKNIGMLTFSQLDRWGFKYDEIYFGKPSADIYIDDKGFKFKNEIELKLQLMEFTK